MKKQKGFTLIELLVVIAIIGILSSVVLASLSTAREKSRDARRIADLGQIRVALEMYYDSSSTYPIKASADVAGSALNTTLAPTYMSKVPSDPIASRNYVYGGSATTYSIAAALERGDNPSLLSDSDAVQFGFDGTSVICNGTAGVARGLANPTELCYDIKP